MGDNTRHWLKTENIEYRHLKVGHCVGPFNLRYLEILSFLACPLHLSQCRGQSVMRSEFLKTRFWLEPDRRKNWKHCFKVRPLDNNEWPWRQQHRWSGQERWHAQRHSQDQEETQHECVQDFIQRFEIDFWWVVIASLCFVLLSFCWSKNVFVFLSRYFPS